MKKEDMQRVLCSGNVYLEMEEIKKTQKNPDALLTLWSNTCAGFLTVLCC